MNDQPIVIVVDTLSWTMHALHLACAIARRDHLAVLLLRMVPVTHPVMLGQPEGSMRYGAEDIEKLSILASVADEYGVEITVQRCQYANFYGGLCDAADELHAGLLFAHLPEDGWPFFTWRVQRLARRLQRNGHQLVTLAPGGALAWTPAVVVIR